MGNKFLKINVCYRYPENKSPYLYFKKKTFQYFLRAKVMRKREQIGTK